MLQHMDSLVVARGLSGLAACGILVAPPGIEPVSPVVEAWSVNHWVGDQGIPYLFVDLEFPIKFG